MLDIHTDGQAWNGEYLEGELYIRNESIRDDVLCPDSRRSCLFPDHICPAFSFQEVTGTRNSKPDDQTPYECSLGDFWGTHLAQPEQNLIRIDMVSKQSNFQILDASPLVLSSHATDGSHFCYLPGPMEFWSHMLYRILQEQKIADYSLYCQDYVII
jgi:hypothetical protein